MIELARIEDVNEIMRIFKQYPTIFPHIRKDKVTEQINKKCCIFDTGVVITFGKYQKRILLGTVNIPKGAWILHQIVNKEPSNGKSLEVLNKFLNYIDNDCYLTVREENTRARNFYEKNGFSVVGDISWKSGEIPRKIYCRINNIVG